MERPDDTQLIDTAESGRFKVAPCTEVMDAGHSPHLDAPAEVLGHLRSFIFQAPDSAN